MLLVLSAIHGDGIGHGLIRGGGHPGFQHIIVGGAPLVDVLGGGQNLLAPFQLRPRQAGGHLEVVDIPVGEQVAPEGHFGGVVCEVFVLQSQLSQAPVGVAVGDDAHHLGVAGPFVCKILDTLPNAHRLRNALDVGVHAVGWDLFHLSLGVLILKIGIFLGPNPAIDGQVGQLIAAVVDVHLAQCFLLRVGGKGSGGKDAQDRHKGQKQRQDTFFHKASFKIGRRRL